MVQTPWVFSYDTLPHRGRENVDNSKTYNSYTVSPWLVPIWYCHEQCTLCVQSLDSGVQTGEHPYLSDQKLNHGMYTYRFDPNHQAKQLFKTSLSVTGSSGNKDF